MEDFFIDFFWDKKGYVFNRSVHDNYPYKIIKKDGVSTIVHNILGVTKEDINVEFETVDNSYTYIKISGKTKNEILNSEFSINSRFKVNAEDIDRIEKEVRDGLLYLDIYWIKKENPNIKIIDK